MAQNYTPRNFAIQQVFEILLRDVNTKAPIAFLDNTKTSGLTNEQTMVYPTGGRGNVYIGGGFGHSRRARLNVTNATWNTDVMAAQIGEDVILGDNKNTIYYDTVTVDVTTKTKFKAIGTEGKEIGTIYELGEDNSFLQEYEQVSATPTAKQFSYASATGLITFGASDAPVKGTRFAMAYTIDAGTSAKTIQVAAAGQPKTALVTAMGLVKDVETGEFYQAQINGLGQISGAWNWELSADGEPAAQTMDIEFVKKYSAKNLYEITVWNEEDAVGITE